MKILLLDGYNLMHRARSGFTRGDNPVIFNFFRSLRALIEKFSPDKAYFVIEGNPVQRKEVLPEYKANRKKPDDSFLRQKDFIIQMMKSSLPIEVVRHVDYECDDVLAGLIQYDHNKDVCTVVSSDSDFYQLYNNSHDVKIYNPVRKKFIDAPDYDYVMWKSLCGDKTDNIHGIRGVGSKTAQKLVRDPSLFSDFLSKNQNREIYERNHGLIKFHDMHLEMKNLERSSLVFDPAFLYTTFHKFQFYSITNDKSWSKFVTTFRTLERG